MNKALAQMPSRLMKVPTKLRLAWQCLRAPYFRWVPPGHYYSALPDMAEVARRAVAIFGPAAETLPGIDLRRAAQSELLAKLGAYAADLPFERSRNPRSRYFRPNGSFPFQDAFMLHAMIRHLRPARLIEIGCGCSTCVILDTCEALELPTAVTCIEPYPAYLLGLLRPEDSSRYGLRQAFVQDVPLTVFEALDAGDILFIDTSHVSKVGSDVNYLFFQVLPRLHPGVVVHFHDIWYPFEYPEDWFAKGMFWNEAYLLRAFLMFNATFEILLWNNFLNRCLTDQVRAGFPLFLEEPGASLWLRRR
jgi:hypothetical protein